VTVGRPRHHARVTGSTSADAVALAVAGAPHGMLVTAGMQTAGRGRQGRQWSAPAGRALLLSVVLRGFDRLLPLRAGIAVAAVCGPEAALKWPNDVLLHGRKVAGILVDLSPRRDWAVLGIGLNVAVEAGDLPPDLRAAAGGLGAPVESIEPLLGEFLSALEEALGAAPDAVLAEWSRRDALRGREVEWADGHGTATGVDSTGALRVTRSDGRVVALDAGEVHLLG
jgi:BirA family biotin operon repressor/biotin-[acetyl-CoA-carboxylase] ligase